MSAVQVIFKLFSFPCFPANSTQNYPLLGFLINWAILSYMPKNGCRFCKKKTNFFLGKVSKPKTISEVLERCWENQGKASKSLNTLLWNSLGPWPLDDYLQENAKNCVVIRKVSIDQNTFLTKLHKLASTVCQHHQLGKLEQLPDSPDQSLYDQNTIGHNFHTFSLHISEP